MSNATKNSIAYDYCIYNNISGGGVGDGIDSFILSKCHKLFFGDNSKYVPTDFYHLTYNFNYNAKKKSYEPDSMSVGGDGIWQGVNERLDSYSFNNNKLEVQMYVYYYKKERISNGKLELQYYASEKDLENNKNLIVKETISEIDYYESYGFKDIEKYKGKLNKFKYVFIKDVDTGNYYFSQVEKVVQ